MTLSEQNINKETLPTGALSEGVDASVTDSVLLYLLDRNFQLLSAPLEGAISVVWSLRFFSCGTFRAVFPLTPALLAAAREAAYLMMGEDGEEAGHCGRIEYLGVDELLRLEIGGRLMESLLSDRVLQSPWTASGGLSECVTAAVKANLRGLPVEIGADSAVIEDSVTLSAAWDNLSSWIYRTLKPFGASYTLTLLPEKGKLLFRIVKPAEDAAVVFSSSFENIAEVTYALDSSERKNVAYVEGNDGTVETADLSGTEEKRELYEKAADLRPTDFPNLEAYREALRLRGRTVLSALGREETLSCEANAKAEPRYGRDYRVGDCCWVDDEKTGLSLFTRITEADEVWENGSRRVYPSFGERLLEVKSLKERS